MERFLLVCMLLIAATVGYAADSSILRDTNDGDYVPVKMRDFGDSTWGESIVNEGVPSAGVACNSLSNATFSTLVSAVNSYLSGSAHRLVDIAWYGAGTITTTHYAVICEVIVSE